MSFYTALVVVALLLPLLILLDYRASQNDPDRDLSQRGPDTLILFTPFLIFFYSDPFWQNLLWFIPLYLVFALTLFIANYMGWYKTLWSILFHYTYSSYSVVILGYFLFLHSGPKSEEAEVIKESKSFASILLSLWPYYATLIFSILTITLKYKFEKLRSIAVPVLILGFPFVPFFAPYYWLGLAFVTILCFYTLMNLAKDAGTGAGAYSAFLYFYLLAAMASIIVRAIFF